MNKDEEEIYGGCFISHFYVFIFRDRIFVCEHNGYAFEFTSGSECAGNCAVQSPIPALWAGMGRAVNNAGAAVVTAGSIALVEGGNVILISSVVLVLFALISITMFATERQQGKKKTEDVQALDLGAFAEKYSLTKRETEVLEALLNSDDSAKDLANQLFISRAALYRHISSLNEKTGTKSRIGLIQFYYQQKNEE